MYNVLMKRSMIIMKQYNDWYILCNTSISNNSACWITLIERLVLLSATHCQ